MSKSIKILILLFLTQNFLIPNQSVAVTQATTIEQCKLAKIAPEPLSAGMPRNSSLIPSTGRIRNLFLYVDFPDNPSNSSSKKFADNYFTKSNISIHLFSVEILSRF